MPPTGRAVKSLRDVQLSDLDAARGTMDNLLWRRAHHVVSENQRTLEAVKVLQAGDLERFGELMNQSHESLRDDYEVSSKELDTLVELARQQPGVLGARMTGAGFGGCTVNLVRADAAEGFAQAVAEGYKKAFGLKRRDLRLPGIGWRAGLRLSAPCARRAGVTPHPVLLRRPLCFHG